MSIGSRALIVVALAGLALPAQAATKVACIGDSITRGAGTTIGGYSTLLAKMLGSGYQVGKFGNSGSTMMKSPTDSYWVSPEYAAAKAFLPDVVVIMLGTNDAKGSWTSADGAHHFEPDYRAMVAELAALPSKPRFVLVWPPPMIRDTLKAGEDVLVKQVNPIISRIAADTGSALARVHDAFFPDPIRYFGDGAGNIADGLHPNDAGAMRIAETVFCALVPAGPKCAAPPVLRDAGADAVRDAKADVGGDTVAVDAEIARADAHADADGEDAHAPPDLGSERDAGPGPKDSAAATGGQGGQGTPEPQPEPEPETRPAAGASGCHCQASPAPPSLFAVTLAAVALIIGRRRR
jgi:MYXO-CTERM domain-containing protein